VKDLNKTTSDMKLVAIDKLVPYANNARTHSPEQINKLRGSLREFGFINPVIIDKDYGILAGHGRVAAAKAEGELEHTLKSLFAVAEAYPQLQASDNFRDLQGELVDTEDKIQSARRFYNGGVRELNIKVKTFPDNIFAGIFGFHTREFFEVEDRAAIEKAPEVKL